MSQSPARSPQQEPGSWNAVAPTYAEDMGQWTDFANEAMKTCGAVAPAARVLDVACGPGTLAFAIAPQVARVDAVDFSPGMIEQVRARGARDGRTNVFGAVMDAQELAFEDATFDAAFCLFGAFFFPDRPRAFAELRRVLRPSMPAVLVTWSPIERRPIMQIAFESLAEAMPQLPRPGKGDLQDPAECVRELTDAGFREVTTHVFTASTTFDSPEHYLDVIVRSAAPIASMRAKMGEEIWAGAKAKILESVRKRIPAEGMALSAEAIVTRGSR